MSVRVHGRGYGEPAGLSEDLLRDVDALGGGGEARVLSDRDEVPQVPQFDVHPEHNPSRRAGGQTGQE